MLGDSGQAGAVDEMDSTSLAITKIVKEWIDSDNTRELIEYGGYGDVNSLVLSVISALRKVDQNR